MDPVYGAVYLALARYIIPVFGFWILLRCGADLLRGRQNAVRDVVSLLLVTVFQGLNGFGFWVAGQRMAVLGYWAVAMLQWLMLLAYVLAGKSGFSLETLLFFLCSLGIGAVMAVKPEETGKQAIAVALGVAVYLLVLWSISHEQRRRFVANIAAVLGLLLPALTLIFGKEYYGAKSWLALGPLSVQPSEISKICFIYAGMEKKSLIWILLYGAVVCAGMIFMNDFGSAVVFFGALFMMMLLNWGAFAALAAATAGIGVGLGRMPAHALRRFALWRHIWEEPMADGFQQTRGLMCIAAGGVFGLGIGAGRMKNIFAADSDVVFATICETWGLLVGVMPLVGVGILLLYAVRMAAGGGWRGIAGCGAVTMLGIQTALNVLGTVDWLPMTGVTLPFVSNGGTAMVASWGLAAFIKAMGDRDHGPNGQAG